MWRTDSLEKTLMLRKIENRRSGDDRQWDGWMASPTRWTWVWAIFRSRWWRGKPGVLQSTGSQTVWHYWAFSSVAQSCLTLCDPIDCSTSGLPVHHQLPESTKPMFTESVVPSNHLILGRPLLLLPSIFLSIRVFYNELAFCKVDTQNRLLLEK